MWRFLTSPFRAVFRAPAAIVSFPRRLLGVSLPTRVAIVVAIFLSIFVVLGFMAFCLTSQHDSWRTFLGLRGLGVLVIIAILIAIPLIVRHLLVRWLEGDPQPFRNIETAWKTGLAELDRRGIDLLHTPLFLVLGAHAADADQAFSSETSDRRALTGDARAGNEVLRWYARRNAIYLVCTDTCQLSWVIGQCHSAGDRAPRANVPRRVAELGDLGKTMTFDSSEDAVPARDADDSSDRQALRRVIDNRRGMQGGDSPAPDYSKTAMVGSAAVPQGPPAMPSTTGVDTFAKREKRTAMLKHVCGLLRRARLNICPHNGILVMLPFKTLQAETQQTRDMASALRADLATIQSETRLRSAVTTLVVGMEEEVGFMKLVDHMGAQRAAEGRFGKGVNIWLRPTATISSESPGNPTVLQTTVKTACAQFENWIYDAFAKDDFTKKRDFSELYVLLTKTRAVVCKSLTTILQAVWRSDSQGHDSLLFGGCYFAGTGRTADRRAFLEGVFSKVESLHNDLAWTNAAQDSDSLYWRLAIGGFTAASLLFAIAIVLFIMKLT